MVISPPTHALDLWSSNRYCQYFYPTKNQVRGLCVGGDITIIFFSYFTEFRENRPHPFFRKFFRNNFKISLKNNFEKMF